MSSTNTGHRLDYRIKPDTWRSDDTCSYCGSLSPSKVVELLAAGATLEQADWKYGWLHKSYIVAPQLYAKFYTTHLQDATPDEKAAIEAAIGMTFTFSGATVSWRPVTPAAPPPPPAD